MTNGVMFSIVSAMMKHVVESNNSTTIGTCKKILEELEKRKGEYDETKVSA